MVDVKTCSICGAKYYSKGLCLKHYSQRPEYREYRKRFSQSPKRKAYMKTYSQSQRVKAYEKERRQNPERKMKQKTYLKAYEQTPKYKEYRKKLRESPEGKASINAYEQKPERKARVKAYTKAYFQTPKGKAIIAVVGSRRRAITRTGDLTTKQWLEIKNKSPICPACGKFVGCENLTLDHIIPLSKGGQHTKDNIQALCKPCNSSKNAKLPKQL